jgi:hypothetical protein
MHFHSAISTLLSAQTTFFLPVFDIQFIGTLGTKSFDDIVDAGKSETFRQWDYRNVYLFQAKGSMASLTVEMRMFVFHRTVTVVTADGIFQRTAPVIDAVYQMMEKEQRDGAGDGRLLECRQITFDIRHGNRLIAANHRPQDEQSHGGRLNVAQCQFIKEEFFVIHGRYLLFSYRS